MTGHRQKHNISQGGIRVLDEQTKDQPWQKARHHVISAAPSAWYWLK
jgi:hypothetical protein